MNKEYPLWLIERIEDIDSYIRILQALKSKAFSLSISPVGVLTDLAVDLIMKIRESYQNEAPYTESPNPQIIFDDMRTADELGNSPQRQRKFYVRRSYSPQMEQFLFHLARFFSRSLKKDFSFHEDFHDLVNSLQEFLPPGRIGQKSKQAEKTNKNFKNVKANQARHAYYRRRRRRK